MRFLADESCDFSVVRALREAGYDIAAIAEGHAGITDLDVMAAAAREGRIVISEDNSCPSLEGAGWSDVCCCDTLRWLAPRWASMSSDLSDSSGTDYPVRS